MAEVFDSPTGWVNQHIQEYIETDGEKGHDKDTYDQGMGEREEGTNPQLTSPVGSRRPRCFGSVPVFRPA